LTDPAARLSTTLADRYGIEREIGADRFLWLRRMNLA
jgi:hypothetical protein